MNRLESIRQREQAATKGPWELCANHSLEGPDSVFHVGATVEAEGLEFCEAVPAAPEDNVFIAHARTDIPLLLAAVDAFRALPEHVLYCRDSVQGVCAEHDSTFSSHDPDDDCDVVEAIRNALAPLLEPEG